MESGKCLSFEKQVFRIFQKSESLAQKFPHFPGVMGFFDFPFYFAVFKIRN